MVLGVSEDDSLVEYKNNIDSTPKFSINGNTFADKGFYINLKKSVERKENVENIIKKFNIEGLLRFDALTDDMIQYSCTKSHLEVFNVCLENGIESVFVAEDDFSINDNLYLPNTDGVSFFEKIELIKKDLNSLEWDVFLFGCNPKSNLIPITDNVAVVNKSTGAWAYLIKKRAFTYLLENLKYKRDYIAIDDYLPYLNEKGFISLTAIPLTIGHAVGFESTLQPRGPVDYTEWIKGSYHKFLYDFYPDNNFTCEKIEKKLTICIPGYFCENYLTHLKYALKSLPNELKKCRFIIRFNILDKNRDLPEFLNLMAYFRDVKNDLNVSLTYSFDGLIPTFDFFLNNIITPYFMVFGFNFIFLDKEKIKLNELIELFDKHSYLNVVHFLQSEKYHKNTSNTIEDVVAECSVTPSVLWSENPSFYRFSDAKELFKTFLKNGHEDNKFNTYLYINSTNDDLIGYVNLNKNDEINNPIEDLRYKTYKEENPLTEND